MEKLIFDKSTKGQKGYSLPALNVPQKELADLIPPDLLRSSPPELPEVLEIDVVRHYTNLSRLNYSVDNGFYPLGSCTMKYNPKINERIAGMEAFTNIHPYQPVEQLQGALQSMYDMQNFLAEITGLPKITLQPAAGAHGELTGMLMVKAYFKDKGETRKKVIIPDSAHGTNPASAVMAGFDVIKIASNEKGMVDLNELKKVLSPDVAALMLTCPNTLGIFEEEILEIAKLVHSAGALLYYDGANLNAIIGIVRPGDMGFDIVHLNLHKTFSTPHGMGGPGSGPVAVKEELGDFLPVPVIKKTEEGFDFDYDIPKSIGKVKAFYGNFNVILKAYAYILSVGREGMKNISYDAVLNANYLKEKLKDVYYLKYNLICMHEFVLSGLWQKEKGVSTLEISKRLIDYGYHPPTNYFPLIVPEAIMIEPTESESKTTLDNFITAMRSIAKEVTENPDIVKSAPNTHIIKRVNETQAARQLNLRKV